MDVFYLASKAAWVAFSPANLLLAWIAAGVFLLVLGRGGWSYRWGKRLAMTGTVFALLLWFVPFGHWALAVLEERIPQPKPLPSEVAGIIVIGGSESENIAATRGELYTNFTNMNRLVVMKMLAEKYPSAQLVYAGGTTRPQTHKQKRQADIAKAVLDVMMDGKRKITYERNSRTTLENAINAKAMVGDRVKQPWLLVTTAWHMPRALGTFRKQGWNVVPMPADYYTEGQFQPLWQPDFAKNLMALYIVGKEVIGMGAYYYAGHTDALFPEAR